MMNIIKSRSKCAKK